MNIRTRHMAIFTYTGLAAIVLIKDIVNTPEMAIALIAPLVGMFTWDKIKGTQSK